jgi:hypothetical protein
MSRLDRRRVVRRALVVVLAVGSLTPALGLHGQAGEVKATKGTKAAKDAKDPKDAKKEKAPKDSSAPKAKKLPDPPLFRTEAPLEMTFTLNLKQIKKDRNQDAPFRPASLTFTDSAGQKQTVAVQAKTRGIWRLKNCDFPPIRLKVSNKDAKKTILADLDEPKLVTYCRNNDTYESYVLQEAQLYRVYRQLTDASHKVRLIRMSYADSATGKVEATRWSFLIEDPSQVADRLGGGRVKQKGASPEDLDPPSTAVAYTFLYFIANTDVSFNGLHNGEIMALPLGKNIPIAYDFDFSGVINASYSGVDPSLPIKSVRERLFRGYCLHADAYPDAFDLFRAKRPAIEALYADPIGKLIAPGTANSTLKYFAEFYDDIKTPAQAKKKLFADCVK